MADRGAPAHSLVGSTFAGKYRVVQHLRSGGIAHVYLAEVRVGRPERLALKVLRDELLRDGAVIRRFERGALAAAGIVHPNVARMGPLERLAGGLPFCTLELLIGLDLADTLAGTGRLDPARARRIAEGAAAGLAAAHAAGVVHLDVKPENLFLVHQADGREHVKLLDFGLSSEAGDPAGAARVEAACSTPEYMAPEQRRGVPPSPAMDVYALGVVLHEMLAGHPPGGGSGVRPSLPRDSAPPSPRGAPPEVYTSSGDVYTSDALAHAPAGLLRVLKRALAREPAERFASMEELRAALVACAEDTPASASGQRARAAGRR